MIATLIRVYWTNLRRDRVAQMMVFLLPIAFFSIFALVFGGRDKFTASRIPVAVADEDRSRLSARLVRALAREPGLAVVTRAQPPKCAPDSTGALLDRAHARAMVRAGDVPVAVVFPAGLDTSFARFGNGGASVTLLADPSDPVAPYTVSGLLEKVTMTAAPDRIMVQGMDDFDRFGGALTPAQKQSVEGMRVMLERASETDTAPGLGRGAAVGAGAGTDAGGFGSLLRIDRVDVLGEKQGGGMVAFYAAGIAVMFLLFSASAGGGALLDEVDSGTLERVLTSNVGMTRLLAGKWLYLTLLGMLQITVMFVWATVAFQLDLLHHLPGFLVMTAVTAATAAGFGLVFATLCRTRAQLSGISTVVILILSAVGGSMFPRFLMSPGMQRAGLVAFNAWALDGYIQVFWRNARVLDLGPQVGVLAAFLALFLVAARRLAARWEQA